VVAAPWDLDPARLLVLDWLQPGAALPPSLTLGVPLPGRPDSPLCRSPPMSRAIPVADLGIDSYVEQVRQEGAHRRCEGGEQNHRQQDRVVPIVGG